MGKPVLKDHKNLYSSTPYGHWILSREISKSEGNKGRITRERERERQREREKERERERVNRINAVNMHFHPRISLGVCLYIVSRT